MIAVLIAICWTSFANAVSGEYLNAEAVETGYPELGGAEVESEFWGRNSVKPVTGMSDNEFSLALSLALVNCTRRFSLSWLSTLNRRLF